MRRSVLEARELPAGADLKRALVAAMLEHIDPGWRLGSAVHERAYSSAIKPESGEWSRSRQAIWVL
jgi:hypothetical protein